MASTLKDLITSNFGPCTPEQGASVVSATLAYLMKVVPVKELNAVIRDVYGSKVSTITYRESIKTGYLLKNVKLWLWWCAHKKLNPEAAEAAMRSFKVLPDDWPLARILFRSKYASAVRSLTRKHSCHDLRKFERILAGIIDNPEINTYIAKYVHRKLRFICQSGAVDLDDIQCELKYLAYFSMLMQYPKVHSLLHFENIFKGAVQKFGVNLIKHYTTQGRQSMVRLSDGTFSSLKVSLHAAEGSFFQDQAAQVGSSGDPFDELEGPNHAQDDKIIAHSLLAAAKGKRFKFLMLLTGCFNTRFTNWLIANGRCQCPNDELFDRCMSEDTLPDYINDCATFLGVAPYTAHQYLNSLRKQLS